MNDLLKAYIIVQVIGLAVVIIMAANLIKKNNEIKNGSCETCENLIRKGGGVFKYECKKPCKHFSDSFDRKPKYCKYYTRRKILDNSEVN